MEIGRKYIQRILGLSEPIYICDKLGLVTFYNKAAAELWGREPETGKELYCGAQKILATDGAELPREQYPMALTIKQEKPVLGTRLIIQRPDGTCRHAVHYSSPLFDARGQFTGAANMLVEVSKNTGNDTRLIEQDEKLGLLSNNQE